MFLIIFLIFVYSQLVLTLNFLIEIVENFLLSVADKLPVSLFFFKSDVGATFDKRVYSHRDVVLLPLFERPDCKDQRLKNLVLITGML